MINDFLNIAINQGEPSRHNPMDKEIFAAPKREGM
jgi:hypothetical protein